MTRALVWPWSMQTCWSEMCGVKCIRVLRRPAFYWTPRLPGLSFNQRVLQTLWVVCWTSKTCAVQWPPLRKLSLLGVRRAFMRNIVWTLSDAISFQNHHLRPLKVRGFEFRRNNTSSFTYLQVSTVCKVSKPFINSCLLFDVWLRCRYPAQTWCCWSFAALCYVVLICRNQL